MKNTIFLLILALISYKGQAQAEHSKKETPITKISKSDAEWKRILTPMQYRVTRHAETERPYTGEYWNSTDKGIYRCVACGLELYSSDTKFECGSGWPSFWKPVVGANVSISIDNSLGMSREEVRCSRCNAHLGHVFNDGPQPTGKRYCMNSASLKFEKK